MAAGWPEAQRMGLTARRFWPARDADVKVGATQLLSGSVQESPARCATTASLQSSSYKMDRSKAGMARDPAGTQAT